MSINLLFAIVLVGRLGLVSGGTPFSLTFDVFGVFVGRAENFLPCLLDDNSILTKKTAENLNRRNFLERNKLFLFIKIFWKILIDVILNRNSKLI